MYRPYITNPSFNYQVFEKLYIKSSEEDKRKHIKIYLELRNTHVINPLKKWRHNKRLQLMLKKNNLKRKI